MPSSTLRRARSPLYLTAAFSLCACASVVPHRIAPAPRAAVGNAPSQTTANAAAAAPVAMAPAAELPADMPLPKLPAYAKADDGASSNEAALEQLRRVKARTGLSDVQLAQLQAAQAQISAGDSASALTQLQALDAELAAENHIYIVQDGESLWHIAAHDEVYGNPYLWPLLWAANQTRVQKPYQVYKGLRLTVPLHPTVQEVSAALAYGKTHASEVKKPAPASAGSGADAPVAPAASPQAQPPASSPLPPATAPANAATKP